MHAVLKTAVTDHLLESWPGANESALQASPSQQGKTLTSHPLPLSPEGSPHRPGGPSQPPFWWDTPDTSLWPEEEAQSEAQHLS